MRPHYPSSIPTGTEVMRLPNEFTRLHWSSEMRLHRWTTEPTMRCEYLNMSPTQSMMTVRYDVQDHEDVVLNNWRYPGAEIGLYSASTPVVIAVNRRGDRRRRGRRVSHRRIPADFTIASVSQISQPNQPSQASQMNPVWNLNVDRNLQILTISTIISEIDKKDNFKSRNLHDKCLVNFLYLVISNVQKSDRKDLYILRLEDELSNLFNHYIVISERAIKIENRNLKTVIKYRASHIYISTSFTHVFFRKPKLLPVSHAWNVQGKVNW